MVKISEEEKNSVIKLLCFTPSWKLYQAYNDNKELIHNYTSNREGFDDKDKHKILGLGIGIFLVLLIISLAFYIWAIIILVKYGKTIPTWALIIG